MSDTLIYDAAARLFGDLATPAVINAAEAGTWPDDLWQAVEEAGFADALVADVPGELSGIESAAAIWRAAGRHAVPLPLAETMLARWLLAGAGLPIPRGPLTVAFPGLGEIVSVRRDGRRWRAFAKLGAVAWAQQAHGIAAWGDDHVICIIPGQAEIRPGKNLAGEPRDGLTLEAALDGGAQGAPGIDASHLYRLGALSRVVLMAGAMEEVLSLSVQYANDRVQFGRPIGKFQAIQQQLAVLAENVAASGIAAAAAVEAVARRGDAAFAVAVAKSRIGEAAGKVAEIAHQVHGAIGFTHEHRLHHLTRRLWSWRDEFGVESEWSIVLGRRIAEEGADGLWPFLTAR